MSIDDDAYFELMMNNCWKMNSNTTYNNEKKGWNNKEEETGNVKNNYVNKQNKTPVKSGRQVNEQKSEKKDETNPIVEKFRQKLASRGGRGIIGLARQFKIFDDNNNKSLEYDEFVKACKDFKVDLTSNEMRIVFQIFDRDNSGLIDYDEFLRALRGDMNERRKRLVMQVYDKLDIDKSGIIDINDIKYTYNVKNHPDVKSGKKTEEDVYGEFLETFETHHNINKGSRDKRVTKEEFLEYYANISMSIDNDDYFELMITNAWKLNGNTNNQKGVAMDYSEKSAGKVNARVQSAKRISQNAPWGTSDEPTNYSTSLRPNNNQSIPKGGDALSKFRAKLAARGTRGIMGIRRSFKICDDDNSREIVLTEFSKLIKDYRIDITDDEIKKLFRTFDRNNSGAIDYDEFLKGIVGDMNEFRRAFVKRAFNKLDKNGNGVIELDDIKGVYNAKQHPDVKAGKKTEDEVLAEFLDTFEYHFNILVNIN
jgi:Ca2+-binding EF-hand superfamily protein